LVLPPYSAQAFPDSVYAPAAAGALTGFPTVGYHEKADQQLLRVLIQAIVKVRLLSLFFVLLATPGARAQLAAGQTKFLGNIQSSQKDENFAIYWNQVTPEDNGKLGYVEPTRGSMDWSILDAIHAYAREHGIPFKEHTFLWGRQQPDWIDSLPDHDRRVEIAKWIREFGQRYPDTQFIDVVNEPLHHPPSYMDALGGGGSTGWDWVIWAYQTTREYCPHAKLLINEFFVPGRKDVDVFLELIALLKERNLVDGIGVQLHAFEEVSDNAIRSLLDRLATTGLPIYISELDINFSNDEAQLNRFKTLFPMLWEHPAVKGVTLWGYKQHQMWRQEAYLLRADGTERPALTWLKEYFHYTSAAPHIASRWDLMSAPRLVSAIILVLILGTSAWLFLSRGKAPE
jgi:endo-1,4-beta-xylanase